MKTRFWLLAATVLFVFASHKVFAQAVHDVAAKADAGHMSAAR